MKLDNLTEREVLYAAWIYYLNRRNMEYEWFKEHPNDIISQKEIRKYEAICDELYDKMTALKKAD